MKLELEAIRDAWSNGTAALNTPKDAHPARGQCAVTALLVQEWFGGELLRAVVEMPDGSTESHYWNRITGMGEIDLTREQYPADYPIPRGEVVLRSRLLEGERAVSAKTAERYYTLSLRAYKALEANRDPKW